MKPSARASEISNQMLRIRIPRKVPPLARSYSELPDIMSYLTRIKTATAELEKRTTRPRMNRNSGPNPGSQRPRRRVDANGKPLAGRPREAGSKQEGATARPQREGASTRPRREASAAGGKEAPAAAKAKEAPAARAKEGVQSRVRELESARAFTRRPVLDKSETSKWTSLKAADRKPDARKPDARKEPRKRTNRRAERREARPRQVGARAPVDDRSYVPSLAPMEALEIVLRNTGTSNGGFIAPYDVSLEALQPQLQPSAATFNARVRTLLNQADASADEAALATLASVYVRGDTAVSSARPLTGSAAALVLNKNRSLDQSTRQYLADVGTGKIAPQKLFAAIKASIRGEPIEGAFPGASSTPQTSEPPTSAKSSAPSNAGSAPKTSASAQPAPKRSSAPSARAAPAA